METVHEFIDKLAREGVKLSVEAGQLNCYAPKGTLTPEVRSGIARYRTEIIGLLEGRLRPADGEHYVRATEPVKEFPLSAGQKGLYILQNVHPEMSAYNVPLCFRLRGSVDAGLLAKAWDAVLDQYPILTARVVERDGALYQRLDDACRTKLRQESIEIEDDTQLLEFLEERAKRPFDPDRGPLTRLDLFGRGGSESILLLTVHHLVIDGTSAMVVARAFLEFYGQLCEGKPAQVSRDLPGYQEFVAWEEAMLSSPEGAAHGSYWRKQLDGELPVFELPSDSHDAVASGFAGSIFAEELPDDLAQWVRDFGRSHSLPPSVVFLALFQLLLHRYTDQQDLIVGMPVMGRVQGRFSRDVGYFINMVPLRTHCESGLKVTDFFRRVQATMLDALFHSSYPFPLMLEKLRISKVRKDPVFQVTYAYQNFVDPDSFAPLLERQTLDIVSIPELAQEGESDLGLEIYEADPSFSVKLKYNPELYTERQIHRLYESYCALIEAVRESSDRPVDEYPIVSRAERNRVLVELNDTRADYPGHRCIHHFFEDQVTAGPGRTAVVFGEERLTYRELYDRCRDLALYLQSEGVGPDSIVGLCMERSVEMMVGIMGTALAGAAYLPLDPAYPDERLTYMLEDSRTTAVLTQEKWRARIGSLCERRTAPVALDAQWTTVSERAAAVKAKGVDLRRDVQPRNLCYVIYTSGSTGTPKGVQVEHQALVNRLHWMQNSYSLTPGDVVLQKTPYSFDVSVWEFFWPMMTGSSIVFAAPEGHKDPDYLQKLIDSAQVTTLHFVPSMLYTFLENARSVCPSVRQVFCSGEALDKKAVDCYTAAFPNAAMHNLYGPTEAAIDVTAFDCARQKGPFVPIGKPIDNIRIYILDRHHQPQPVGVPGELHIAGDGLARGYLNRPELTREKFVENPFVPGTRMYKTGDLARWLDDGNIQYLGRIDTQVKIRGFRIELGEIEARLNQHPSIQDSAVIAQGEGVGRQLVAFYRARGTSWDEIIRIPNGDLRAHLLRTLPDYMVPAAFVSLPAIPLTSSGKADRRALAGMAVTPSSDRKLVAPRNDAERRMASIWAEVLNLAPETIGVDDSFFERGGHSLLATQLVSKIRAQFDVDLPLKAVFERTTVAQLADLVASSRKSVIPPIRPVDRSQFERLPLSFAQERLWFLNQLEPDSAGYNVPGAVSIRGPLDVDRLDEAFNLIISRHENLRTVFPSADGQVHQSIRDAVDFRLERVDLSHCSNLDVRNAEARRLCQADAAAPFDLAQGPLFRGKVIRLEDREHILMLNMHHIISDGWSLGVLVRELDAIMQAFREGRRPDLPPLPIQYVDYSVWQREWLEKGGVLDEQLAYWQQKLAGVPESLDLATDHPRPSVQSFAGATRPLLLNSYVTRKLKRLADEQGATLYMVLLAALDVLLHRYTGQNDLCVGSPIANRQYGETEGLIGMFVNTLALRTQVTGQETFPDLVQRVRATCLEAYEHQDAPFEKIVDAVCSQRNLAISPLFQVMLVLQNVDMGSGDQQVQRYPLDSGISKFDLTFEFTETRDGLSGSIEYCTALFAPETIERMADHFTALVKALVDRPGAGIRDIDFLSGFERQRLLADFNATRADYRKDPCLHDLFTEQVPHHADAVAAICGEERLTYAQLHTRSEDLALYLQSLGVEPDKLVGVCMERSLTMLVGLLGVLQAGGAYVPLDPAYPDERLAYTLEDSRAGILLTQESLREQLSGLVGPETRIVTLDGQAAEIADRVAELKANGVALQRRVQPDHLAYVIYTSGSTGKPKGVAIEHHSPVTLVHWARDVYSPGELAGVLASTSICFDLSIFEMFVTLASGGTVILVPNALALVDLPHRNLVTLVNTVPSAMEELVRMSAIPDSVRTINLAGEPLSARLVDKIYGTCPVEKVYDLYGPSEDTTYSTFVLRRKGGPQTIGRPVANSQVYILDPQQRIQPIGVPGELHIAGDGLARGYLYRPDLTKEKFIANPFEPGTRMYRTGDRARWLVDGNIQYLGRMDTQVKIRGFRIEIGEIEVRLTEHEAIQDCAVIAQGEGAGRQLVAFYRAKETKPDQLVEVPARDLRAHLLRTLPEYMVPAAFVSLAAIPLNPNGKVDRRALARIDVTMTSADAYVAPRNETERRLVGIWAEVLDRAPETIGVNDNFFELGGHSLLATQLISKIRRQLEVELSLKTVFDRTTVAQLAVFISKAEASDVPPIVPVDRTLFERLPLSFAEERVWFMNQLAAAGALYSVPGAVVMRGELNLEHLDEAFNLIIERHENLRTIFPSDDGQTRRVILDRLDFHFDRADLSAFDKETRDLRAKEICLAVARKPFDLDRGPLITGNVIRLAEQEHIVMVNMHHMISDGWSIGVLVAEFRRIMDALGEGRRPDLPPLPIQYVDYAVWQRQWLEGGRLLKRQMEYWQEKLAGVPESLDLATDYPRSSTRTPAGATRMFPIDAQLTADLKKVAEEQGGTLFMVLLAGFMALLHRYTGQKDICIGSPIANRNYGETEGLIGMFVNTLALRSQVEPDETFLDLLDRVKTTCLEAYENQDAPFAKVVDMMHLSRNAAVSPLFQVMLVLQNIDMGTLDQQIQRYFLDTGVTKYDLTVEFSEIPEGLDGSVEYSTSLFRPETIARLTEHYTAFLRAIVANPAARISAIDYLSETETRRLLFEFNATRTEYPREKCIHDFFVEQVATTPDRRAVAFGGETLTYRELYDRSNDLALFLQSRGVRPDTVVGLCLERSLEMMAGIMGTVLAGGAYMPLDPAYPDDRLSYMMGDSASPVVLTQQRFADRMRAMIGQDAELVILGTAWPEIRRTAAALRSGDVSLQRNVGPRNLCYVIYTSGSTGRPKGVQVEHQALVNRLVWMQECYALSAADVVLQKTPYSFDVSVWEFFWPMMTGASIVFAVPGGHRDVGYLENLIQESGVTTLHFVPSMLAGFLDAARVACPTVRRIFCSGEALEKKAVDRYRTPFPNAVMHNLYGPTEAAIDVTAYDCSLLDHAFVPIGAPISNIQIHILDSHGNVQPIGKPGELHIAGEGLARGYLNRPELTREKFVDNPFAPGTRMYKTGDLARWLDDGNIQYLGRIDTQVKIRGFRIELSEIEARLAEEARIAECAVVARGDGADRQLIAFYRAKDSTPDRIASVPAEELRAHLMWTLPDYMVPAAFASLAAIPLNTSGKVDRVALSRMDVAMVSNREYVEPRNATERELVGIWAEILKLDPEKIGVHDNFFALGGHSLSGVQLISRIARHFKRSLPLSVIFTAPDIAAFASLLTSAETPFTEVVVPIQTGGSAVPIFGVPGAGGVVLSLQPLSRAFGTDQPFHGLQAIGLDGRTPPLTSVEQTARINVDALRKVQPAGPYKLLGHSYGGVVAYEMARILLEQAEKVESLTLLDSIAPELLQDVAPDDATELRDAFTAIANLHGVNLDLDPNHGPGSDGEPVRYMAGVLSDLGFEINQEQLAAFVDVFRANLSCYRAYKPSPLPRPIDVALYRATRDGADGRSLPNDYGWNRLLPTPIRIHDVEADHFTILDNVQFQDVAGVHA